MYYFGLGNVYWSFRFRKGNPPFWNLANVLSPEGTLRSKTQWVPFDSLSILFWTFRFSGGIPPFWNLENVLSPEGTLRSRTQWGPFDSVSILLCLRRGVWTVCFTGGNPPFWNLANVLFPGGTLLSRARKGSNCFYLCFIPRRDSAKQNPNGIQLILFPNYCLKKVLWHLQLIGKNLHFWNRQNSSLDHNLKKNT